MEATVYATAGGRRFHKDADCRALIAGQSANSDGSHYAGTGYLIGIYPPVPVTVIEAMWAGKLPCSVCMPDQTAAWFRAPSENDFGHEPVPGFLADHAGERTVCARCETAEARSYWLDDAETKLRRWVCRSPVHWPCKSALVLGLVPREEPEDIAATVAMEDGYPVRRAQSRRAVA